MNSSGKWLSVCHVLLQLTTPSNNNRSLLVFVRQILTETGAKFNYISMLKCFRSINLILGLDHDFCKNSNKLIISLLLLQHNIIVVLL
jgi:hypothetical protein